jgi:hypothetical protein
MARVGAPGGRCLRCGAVRCGRSGQGAAQYIRGCSTRSIESRRTTALFFRSARRCRICAETGLTPGHICAGSGLAPATSAPGPGSPLPHLRWDWAHRCHICTRTPLSQGTPLARTILGPRENVRSLTRDHLKSYIDANYTAPRMYAGPVPAQMWQG